MKSVDTHFHLWDLSQGRHDWLRTTEKNSPDEKPGKIRFAELSKNYLIEDYFADIGDRTVDKGIHVEARYDEDNPVAETAWLQSIADRPESRGFPHGIIAYLNLANDSCSEIIERHAEFANFRGIRQVLNQKKMLEHCDYLLEPKWRDNFSILQRFEASFDLQVFDSQMSAAAKLARRYPETTIVLNHAGMPQAASGEVFAIWRKALSHIASCDNVSAKICGLGMGLPRVADKVVEPILNEVIAAFGIDRVMFGSNFPVDKLFSTFDELWTMYDRLTSSMSQSERAKLFYDNAVRIYRL